MIQKYFTHLGMMLIGLMLLQSCDQPKHVAEKPAKEIEKRAEVIFERIQEGYLTGNGEEKIAPGGMVIRSQEELNELLKKMNSVNQTIDPIVFDFDRVTAIVYFDEIRGSGGYSVDVAAVTETGQTTVVAIKKSPSDGMDIEIMTQPYVIGYIPQTKNQIRFQD